MEEAQKRALTGTLEIMIETSERQLENLTSEKTTAFHWTYATMVTLNSGAFFLVFNSPTTDTLANALIQAFLITGILCSLMASISFQMSREKQIKIIETYSPKFKMLMVKANLGVNEMDKIHEILQDENVKERHYNFIYASIASFLIAVAIASLSTFLPLEKSEHTRTPAANAGISAKALGSE